MSTPTREYGACRNSSPSVGCPGPTRESFYLMFIGHYFDGGQWSDQNINGIIRFFKKWEDWMSRTGTDTVDINKFKQTVFGYTDSFKFNKVVSSFMIMYNENKDKSLDDETKRVLNEILNIFI